MGRAGLYFHVAFLSLPSSVLPSDCSVATPSSPHLSRRAVVCASSDSPLSVARCPHPPHCAAQCTSSSLLQCAVSCPYPPRCAACVRRHHFLRCARCLRCLRCVRHCRRRDWAPSVSLLFLAALRLPRTCHSCRKSTKQLETTFGIDALIHYRDGVRVSYCSGVLSPVVDAEP